MKEKPDYLGELRKRIEQQLGWGEPEGWTQQDFLALSDQICDQTSSRISVTTLKRIWGKVAYDSHPTSHTLNAIASFAEFDSWQQYVGSFSETASNPIELPLEDKAAIRRPLVRLFIFLILAAVAAAILWAIAPDVFPSTHPSYTVSEFNSKPVTEGLPNTVIFSYAFDRIPPEGTVFIQQSWDPRLRHEIDPAQQTFSCTYYYPGYFRAKLMVDETIIEERDVYVPSNGWMGIVEEDPIPHYLPSNLNREGVMGVSVADLQERALLSPDKTPVTSYLLVDDLGEISGTDFQLETAIKQTYSEAGAVCQTAEIRVLCTNGHFQIPLSIPGCVGTLTLWMSEKRIDGETADLSAFGADMSQFQHIRLAVRSQVVTVMLGDTVIYEGEFAENPGEIVGVRYRFLGNGVVDYLRLKNGDNNVVLEDEFNGNK